MKPESPCADCALLIGSPIVNEPHSSLELRSAAVLAPSDSRYYECKACGVKLLRSQQRNDPLTMWRMR